MDTTSVVCNPIDEWHIDQVICINRIVILSYPRARFIQSQNRPDTYEKKRCMTFLLLFLFK